MSLDVSQIIPINETIRPAGLGVANFATAALFAPQSELPTGFAPGTYRVYSSLTAVAEDFDPADETYLVASKWFGGVPAVNSLHVYGMVDADSVTENLDAARNQFWWFWSFFTRDTYADPARMEQASAWCESARSFFINCQTGTSATAIRDPGDGGVAEALTLAGRRLSLTFTHATDPYAGIALAKWFANVDYTGTNTAITGEYKKLSGVSAEDLTATAHTAMTSLAVRSAYYGIVESRGSEDIGRVINTRTHSAFGEWLDEVVDLEAFTNAIRIARYNAIANQPSRIGQDPEGQAVIDGAVRAVCEQYLQNGFLGPRNYVDPDDGLEKYTVGYEILSKPEDILDLPDSDRSDRKAAPLRLRIFRRGAVHVAEINLEVI